MAEQALPNQADINISEQLRPPVPGTAGLDSAQIGASDNEPSRTELIKELQRKTGQHWPRFTGVGDTPLVHLRALEHALRQERILNGKGRIFVKIENNITGTFKDRAMCEHVKHAVEQGFRKLAIPSCGNAAESLAVAVVNENNRRPADDQLELIISLPQSDLTSKGQARLHGACGAEIHSVKGNYDAAVSFNEKITHNSGVIYDAASIGPNGLLEIAAYKAIGREIVDDFYRDGIRPGEKITAVFMPVGNGTLYRGIFEGLWQKHKEMVISEMPQVIGGTVPANPLRPAGLIPDKPALPEDVERERRRGNRVRRGPDSPSAAPLATDEPCFKDLVKDAEEKSRGWVGAFDDKKLQMAAGRMRRAFEEEGLKCKPLDAGCAGLAELVNALRDKRLPRDGTYVIVISGVQD